MATAGEVSARPVRLVDEGFEVVGVHGVVVVEERRPAGLTWLARRSGLAGTRPVIVHRTMTQGGLPANRRTPAPFPLRVFRERRIRQSPAGCNHLSGMVKYRNAP